MPKEIEHCHECGAKKVIYRHRLNKGLVTGLRALYDAGGVAKLSSLNLTVSQHNNFQKLRYWMFIQKQGRQKWKITRDGREFIRDKILVSKVVMTYRGEPMLERGVDIDLISIDAVIPGYQKPQDYIRESENLTKSGHLFPEMA